MAQLPSYCRSAAERSSTKLHLDRSNTAERTAFVTNGLCLPAFQQHLALGLPFPHNVSYFLKPSSISPFQSFSRSCTAQNVTLAEPNIIMGRGGNKKLPVGCVQPMGFQLIWCVQPRQWLSHIIRHLNCFTRRKHLIYFMGGSYDAKKQNKKNQNKCLRSSLSEQGFFTFPAP